jgi:Protein of unknown function (DUF3341)
MIPRKGTADVYLSAEFYDKKATSLALLELKAKGFDPASLAVFSDQPLELADGVLDRPSRMSLAVVTSAIVFLLLIIWFVYYTQYDYPLVTGGMPLFSFWATGVIFYEITMFGAIAATFILFLLESGLLRRGHRAPAPILDPGAICVRVFCRSNQAEDVGQSLRAAGAMNIRTLEEAS